MPKFKPNTSTFRMSGYSYPGTSPIKQEEHFLEKEPTAPMVNAPSIKGKMAVEDPTPGPPKPPKKLQSESFTRTIKPKVHKKKKRGWFGLPDLGITEALDAMKKTQRKMGTGFFRKN